MASACMHIKYLYQNNMHKSVEKNIKLHNSDEIM